MAKTPTTPTDYSLPDTVEVGMLVRMIPARGADLGTYRVFDVTPNKDGSVRLYGGDVNVNGNQSFRAIKPENLMLENRKDVLAARRKRVVG